MCNPISNSSISVTDHNSSSKSQQTHLYLDLLSLPINPISQSQNDKTTQTQIQSRIVLPNSTEIFNESRALFSLAFPIALTALIVYSRSILSMLFLGRLGDSELAAGSLAIAFANITGYSVLSGLALGMEPLCSQAFGAQRPKLLSLTLHKSVLFLLSFSIPIGVLWLNITNILICLKQDPYITRIAHTYLMFSLPDLVTNSFIHPIRIYLRAQGITHAVTLASLVGAAVQFPLNFILVNHFGYGVAGVAAASATSNVVALVALVIYVGACGLHAPTWTAPSWECLSGWKPLLKLAAPSCVSVCLEWWWYEIMIVLCGLLIDPKATVASMGVLIQTTSLIYVFPSSLGFAVSTRVGNELGANRPNKARVSAFVSILLAFAIGLSAMFFAYSMRDIWSKMFTTDVTILRLTSTALPILGLCELGNCPQTVGCGVVRGTARPTTAANVNLGAFYLVGMPVAVGLGFWAGFGFEGLWLGLLSAQITCAGLMLYVVGSTDWEEQAVEARMLTCAEGDENVVSVCDGKDENQPLICVEV